MNTASLTCIVLCLSLPAVGKLLQALCKAILLARVQGAPNVRPLRAKPDKIIADV
jgi:hypothetical protein